MSGSPSPTPPGASAPVAPSAASTSAEFVRIGVAGPAGRADLAVPAGIPLARLMLTLLQHAGGESEPDGGVRHGGWVLRRVDGTRLVPEQSLAAQGVREGDLLFLGHGDEDATPPLYDDVVEVIGAHGVRGTWSAVGTRRAAGALAVIAVLAACGALVAAPGRLPGWLGLATALGALAVGVLMARAFADPRAGTVAGVLAAPLAGVGAVRLLGTEAGVVDGFTAGHLLLACAVVAAVGALGPVLVGGGDGTFTALVVAGPLAAAGAAVCAVWGVEPARAASVVAPLALAVTTAWPTVALRLARIPAPHVAGTAEDLEQLPSQLAHEQLRARVARARRLLVGMVVGSHLVAGGGALVLFAAGGLWPSVLGGVLVVLMLLRARLFKEAGQAAIPMVTALVGVAAAAGFGVAGRVDAALPLLGVALPVALVTALVAGSVSVFAGRYRMNPRLSRALDLLEVLVLVSVVPLVLAVWDVYATLLNLKV